MNRIMLIFAGLLLAWNAHALELAGVKLPDTAQVDGQTLVLNGAGIRTKWFFKVYVGALYLPHRQSSAEAIIAADPPSRVSLHMLRELGSKRLYHAFDDAIEANQTPDELQAMDAQLKQMAAIFDTAKEVRDGDVVTLDHLPGGGTQISLNGRQIGTIAGAEFSRALLRIWLGAHPAQDDLKKEMLGG